MVGHINVWLFAFILYVLSIFAIIHNRPNRRYLVHLVFEVCPVQRLVRRRAQNPQGVLAVLLLHVHGEFGLYFVGCRFTVIFPAGVVTGLNSRIDANTALAHYSLAHLVGFFLLVVPHKLDSFIVGLSLSEYVLVGAQKLPKSVSEVLHASFLH